MTHAHNFVKESFDILQKMVSSHIPLHNKAFQISNS